MGYFRVFDNKDKAYNRMVTENRSRKNANNYKLVVLVDHPDNKFAVIELKDAVDMGLSYEWSFT